MANEFKVKNGLIVIGDLTTSGTITINGALAATQSWVTSQAYLTSASLSGYATQSYVTSAISALIDAAPAALDTLNELAAALGDDASFSTTVTNSIAGKVAKSGDTMTGSLTFASTADNVRIQKNSSFLNLRDPYNNIHLYNAGDGTYIDANVHHWRSQGASYWMTLNGTGLGIGTQSPSEKLQVEGNIKIQNGGYLRFTAGSVGTAGFTVFNAAENGYLSNRITTSDHARGWGWELTDGLATTASPGVFFRVGYAGTSSYLTSGNFGIGTTSPSEKLHVSGAAIFDGGAGNSSTDSVVYITKSNNNDWGLYVNASGLDYGMYARVSPSAGYAIGVNNGTDWTTRITGNAIIYLGEKNAIEGNYDTWLRLNNSNHYTSGVYTPGVMRADGGFNVSGSTVWHAGNDGSGSGLDADTLDGLHASSFLLSNFGNVEGEHSFGYPSSDGWYKIAEVVLNGTCQSYNLWGEYRDTGYFDNSHYRIHITARAECDFLSNNESHAINVNIYGSSTNETYFTNNVRVILTSSSSNYRKYELQYYRATWDTGSWRLQTLGWTTYTTSQTAGTSTGTPRVYYISKFVADNIYAANKISIGTSYSGFAANIAGTTYIIGGSVWTQNGYGFTNSGSNNTGMFPDSNHVITFKNNNSDNVTINASGNVGIGTSSPAQKLHVEGIARLGGSTTDGALYVYSSNGTLNSLISGPGNTYLNATYGNVGVGVNPTSGDKLEVAGSVRIHTGNNWDGIQIYAGGQDGYIRGIGDEVGLHIRSEYGNVLLADDRGKVGIGLTTPQKKLDVYGTGIVASFGGTFGPGDFAGIHFGYSESNSNNDIYKKSALVFERTDNHNQGGNASGKIHFLLNNAISTSANSLTHSVVTIDSDANGTVGSVRMGIGTRNPSYPLEVNGGATSNNIARFTTGGVGGGTRGLTMYSDNSQLKLQVSDNVGGIGSWAFLNLNPDGGNVGIGTTAPDEKLQVAGNIKIQNETGLITDYGPLVGRYNTSQVYVGTGGNYSIVKIGRADGGALNVLSGGNVGIGTSTPSEKLEVYGNSYVSGQSFLRSHFSSYTTDGLFNANALWSGVLTPSGVYRVRFGYLDQGGGQYWGRVGFVGNTNWSLGTAQGGHSFSIGTGNGNSEFLINNAGKVSIGTTDTNSDKSDFTVYTGGNTSIALAGNLFRVGESDINWDIALRSNGFLETYAQPLYLRTIAGSQPVVIGPNGTNTVEFYPDYTLFNGLNLAISRTNSTHGAGNYFRGDASHLVIGTGGTLYLNYGGGTTIITGNTTVSGLLGVTGIVSANARKLSLGILDLNTSGVPGQFKIKTSIPWNYGGSDFTVNIKGFRYGSSQMVSLSIGWHFYNNEFYSRNAICNGAWAPTITLAKSPDGYVIIHLPSPDYWAKLYVESVYSSNSADSYTSGWSWSDADLSDCTLIQTVPYRDLATNISGNAATATFATTAGALSSMNISQFTNNSGYITGYTETDTLNSVTSRGASTSNAITVGATTINGIWQTNISTAGGWSKLSFTASNAWGDGTTYGTLGASGGNEPGVMVYNMHATWAGSSQGAGIRMGRSGGVAGGSWYQVATMDSDEFMIAKNGQWSNGGIKITSGGELQHGNSGNKYWHAGNDGSGSGLDADTVDGIDSGSFLRSDVSDSFSGTLTMATQRAFIPSNYGHGVYGLYSAERYQHVWSMGAGYDLPADGASNGNGGSLYGLAWSYNPDYSYVGSNAQSKPGLNHQLLLMMNGITHTAIGSGIWTNGTITTVSHGTSAQWNTAYGWGNHASQGYATTSYVTTQINNLINGAPGALDTLSELASALGNDASFATTVTNSIASKLSLSGGTMTGTLTLNAELNAYASPIYVNEIRFRDTSGSPASDPYSMRWVSESSARGAGLSWLEFQLNDDNNEEIRIYGNSCAGYGCGAVSDNLYHRFRADGYAWHAGNLSVAGTISASGYNDSNWNTAYGWGNHASAGYAAASSLANYLSLAGGTLSGSITATRFQGVNSLVLNNYTIVNPSSNVFLYSQPNDRDAWIFLDSADTGSNWGIYHRQIDTTVGDIPANSIGFVGGGASVLQAYISLANGNAYFRGNLVVGGVITESSSIKLKENVETSEGNLEKVVNLRPVTYNKIGSQTTELGLIAEEVAEVYPEFVQYDENGEPVGVHYSRLTAALIGAVKELTNQVQELNKKING